MAAKNPTAGGNPAARGLLDSGLGTGPLITPGSSQAQITEFPHHRLPPPWRPIGEIVDEIVEKIARRLP
jgi:hypothetical protein